MANVAFWGTVHGQASTTSNLIAVSHFMSLEEETRNLITQTHWSHSNLESVLIPNKNDANFFHDTGIDAIERLARSNRLQANNVRDYTETVMTQLLELLPGTTKREASLHNNIQDVMSSIMWAAKNDYDLAFYDINSGTQNEISRIVLEESDLVVVNLNQNAHVLERFFSRQDYLDILDFKPYIILLSQYDAKSRMTLKNIKRKYNVKQPMFAVPYCTKFRDSINDKRVTEFLIRAHNFTVKHEDYIFTKALKDVVKGMNKAIKMMEKSVKGAS